MILRLIRTGRDRIKKTVLEPDGEVARPVVGDKAVSDFTRVCKEEGLELDYERDAKRIKELIEQPGEGPEGIEELATLLGQDDPNKDKF